MTGNEYQRLASRTIRTDMTRIETEYHALHGMVSEIGELHGIYQKHYQGHYEEAEEEHLKKETGDLIWFVAEYCTANGWKLEDVMRTNIEKLEARYPKGFSVERSEHRAEGDV